MSGLINKVKEAIHSDKDKKHDSTTHGTHDTHNTHSTHSSGLPEGATGPHSSPLDAPELAIPLVV
ncbi:hypothetical protein HYE68_008226 [Fusarium pseudograminearum]|nr:hypothetical protein HYE68_008226 [Fusarium pseudograminearum]